MKKFRCFSDRTVWNTLPLATSDPSLTQTQFFAQDRAVLQSLRNTTIAPPSQFWLVTAARHKILTFLITYILINCWRSPSTMLRWLVVQSFEQATVMFSSLIGFTELVARYSPATLAVCVNSVFDVFDSIVDYHHVFKARSLARIYLHHCALLLRATCPSVRLSVCHTRELRLHGLRH